jgi:LytS/YehU family sensor histidine kinase
MKQILKKIGITTLIVALIALTITIGTHFLSKSNESFAKMTGYFTGILVTLLGAILTAYILGIINHRWCFNKVLRENNLKNWVLYTVIQLMIGVVIYVLSYQLISQNSANIIVFVTISLMNLGTIVVEFFQVQEQKAQLLIQKTEAELTALKAQVNPHFLFNALNTIYNEAQKENGEHTAKLIEQLSTIMRFTLQESKNQFTNVEKELIFLNKYIDLQKARIAKQDSIDIRTSIDWDEQPTQIAPLLLIPFIENAFQYAISYDNPSFIDINLNIEEKSLDLEVKNSISSNANLKKGTGIGIENVRKRLELIYPNRHNLMINQTKEVFQIKLKVNL